MRVMLGVMLVSGCNAVYGIDETGVINDNPRTLVFDNSASAVDLIDFPLPVFIDPTRIDYAQVADPTTELRFYDPDTAESIPFEVETWDPTGESLVWVRVPAINKGSKTDRILMYFGAAAAGSADASALWSDYEVVLHGVAGSYQSAPRATTINAVGITTEAGALGPAVRLGATGEHGITYGNTATMLDAATSFTIDLWMYADFGDGELGNREPHFLDLPQTLDLGRVFDMDNAPQYIRAQIDVHFASYTSYRPTFVPLRKWVHLTWSYDGTLLWVYRNGAVAEIDVVTGGAALQPGSGNLVIGGVDPLDGLLDEVRVSRKYRDDNWIDAEYRAMQGTFVTFPRPGELP